MKNIKSVATAAAIGLGIAGFGSAANAVVINGADFGGADLTLSNGDVLVGSFTNIGNFNIPVGVSVFVQNGTGLSVGANNINIFGTLDAQGAGFAGGQNAQSGNPGSGPGAGAGGQYGGAVHASGGAGGGYGGVGGNGGSSFGGSPPPSIGGTSYGVAIAPGLTLGSGGGGAGNHGCCNFGIGGDGGAGGGAVMLTASGLLTLTGSLVAAGDNGTEGVGADYPASGGGGGAGGTIALFGNMSLDGLLDVSGGIGADFNGLGIYSSLYGNAGGGGAGGRIAISGAAIFGTNFAVDVSGGDGGISRNSYGGAVNATAGGDGSFSDETEILVAVPEPGMIAVFGLGLAGLAVTRRRRAA